ncbi:CBS domain-containing protein [Salicibibacter cibarius]|uniref:CBS domain-containing protein n=1 Tax=Salicibibacter cibarius TaxID=2743000 RepID=A0A7T6Z526_9BACI|nr:CBS domain-containing protein [Salicibibacter cibarius]QQK76943.1 CBS domain-containing protein [Salicibibacter cibarius]
MKIIASHKNTDFDALASLVAAKKLYPDADILLPAKIGPDVKNYLAIYRDQFPYINEQQLPPDGIDELILVDTYQPTRASNKFQDIQPASMTVYDHHPESFHLPHPGETAEVGATITILLELIQAREIALTDWERTLFALGLYTDTGSFTHEHTSNRDVRALLFLFNHGFSLDVVNRFSDPSFSEEQQALLLQLLQQGEVHDVNGVSIMIGTISAEAFIDRLNLIVEKWLDLAAADACIAISEMKNTIFVTARSRHPRVNVSKALAAVNGGGHPRAAAATIKDGEQVNIAANIQANLFSAVAPALVAKQMMSQPVKTVTPDTSIEAVRDEIRRYGHSGFPVQENGQLVGMISRRDVDKAVHHGLGHAPVKGHMNERVITCEANATSEDVQKKMITHDIGRLPVLANSKLIGIISRSDLLQLLHDEHDEKKQKQTRNMRNDMTRALSADHFDLLQTIGYIADQNGVQAYLIGGIVRDLLLERENEDIDIVIEGDGIAFAKTVADQLEGALYTHNDFKTATIILSNGQHIDVASARAEYYDAPAALPNVRFSNLREDLYRRDFTFNALAIRLNEADFGTLIDPFGGEQDLQDGVIRVLHNLSFIEDPTRILRAIRFELKFSYTFAADTQRFAELATSAISHLSAERIKAEFQRLFVEVSAAKTFKRLEDLNLLGAFIPFAVWSRNADQMISSLEHESLPENLYTFSRLLPLFAFDGALQHLTRFALTKAEKQLLNTFERLQSIDETAFNSLGTLHENVHEAEETNLVLFEKYTEVLNENMSLMIKRYRDRRRHMPALLSGEDLRKLPMAPGPHYKRYLLKAESLWLDDKLTSRDDALQWLNGSPDK